MIVNRWAWWQWALALALIVWLNILVDALIDFRKVPALLSIAIGMLIGVALADALERFWGGPFDLDINAR